MDMRWVPTELELFNWLKKHYYYDLQMTEGDFESYDAVSREFGFYAELKARTKHYERLIIEKSKHDRVLECASEARLDALYIVATPLGVWQWDLVQFGVDWVDMPDLPLTTQFADTSRVTKRVGLLPVNRAKRLGEARTTRKGGGIYGNR